MTFDQAKQRAIDAANATGKTYFVQEHEYGYKAIRVTGKNTLSAAFSEFLAEPEVRA